MATNFYLELRTCLDCGRSDRIHIGNLTCGKKFLFRIHKDEDCRGVKIFDQKEMTRVGALFDFLKEYNDPIIDEYGQQYNAKEFIDMVERHQDGKSRAGQTGIYQDINGYEYSFDDF